jgi:hypothetical protein
LARVFDRVEVPQHLAPMRKSWGKTRARQGALEVLIAACLSQAEPGRVAPGIRGSREADPERVILDGLRVVDLRPREQSKPGRSKQFIQSPVPPHSHQSVH